MVLKCCRNRLMTTLEDVSSTPQAMQTHTALSQLPEKFFVSPLSIQRSTTMNLINALDDRSPAIKNRFSVAVTYINYTKAFNTVSLLKLCHKLEACGMSGSLLLWMSNPLS